MQSWVFLDLGEGGAVKSFPDFDFDFNLDSELDLSCFESSSFEFICLGDYDFKFFSLATLKP